MRMHIRPATIGKLAATALAGALLAACGATPGTQSPSGTQVPYGQLAPTGNPEATRAANGGVVEVTTVPTNEIDALATAEAPTPPPDATGIPPTPGTTPGTTQPTQ